MIEVIGALALNLHKNRSEELICAIPMESMDSFQQEATADYLVDDKTIRFASLEARNRCIASYEFERNKTVFAGDARKWLHTAHELWRCEIGKSDSASGRLLALVHETDDIFSIAANAIETKSVDVFDALHVIKAALPHLNELVVSEIFKLCAAQNEGTRNDLFAGLIFNELEKFFIRQPNTARATHLFFRDNIAEETANLHSVSLIALAKSSPEDAVKLALEDTGSQNVILKSMALWTLGRLLASSLTTADSISSVSTAIIAHMTDSVEQVRLSAIRAAAQAAPITDAFDDSLILLGEAGDQQALSAVANALFMSTSEMKLKANFNAWFRLLSKVLPSSKGVLDNFDHILGQMIADPEQQQFAIACLTDWVEANAKDVPRDKSAVELFDGTVSEIANRPELLSQVITDWFLSDSRQLAAAAAGFLSHLWVHKLRDTEFSTSRLDSLEPSDLIFLVRRMLGFVSSEEHLLSLTMSLLKTKDASQRTFGIVHSLLIDELGEDYPSSTVEMLESGHVIDITLGLLLLHSTSYKLQAQNWLAELVKRIDYTFKIKRNFPICTDSTDDLVEATVFGDEELRTRLMRTSWLLPTLAAWSVMLERDDLYAVIAKNSKTDYPEICLQLWHPTQDLPKHLYFRMAQYQCGESEAPINLPDTAEEFRVRMKAVLESSRHNIIESSPAWKEGIPAIDLLACRHFRTPVAPFLWYQLLRADNPSS